MVTGLVTGLVWSLGLLLWSHLTHSSNKPWADSIARVCQAYIISGLDSAAQILSLGVGHLFDVWLGQVWVVQDVVQQNVSMVLQVPHLVLQHQVVHQQSWPK